MNVYDVIVNLKQDILNTSLRFNGMSFDNPLNKGDDIRVYFGKDGAGLEESLSLGYVQLFHHFPNSKHIGMGSQRSIAQTSIDVDWYEKERITEYHKLWVEAG